MQTMRKAMRNKILRKRIGGALLMGGMVLMCINQDTASVTQIWVCLSLGLVLMVLGAWMLRLFIGQRR